MDVVPDDVVISGIGGYYPKATNLEDFKNRLFENKPLQEPRWPESKNISNLIGCVDSNYFDNSYFGIHRQQCFFMDPMHRLALECAFSALLDAGVNPTEIRGKRVGVFMGSTIGENDQLFMESVVSGFGVTGHSRAMLANRISYWLNLKGPSVAYDANWVTGIEVLRLAFYAIKTGQCDSVLIGAANLAQHDEFQHMYNEMGLLSQDGSTKAFDANATGYARSEGVVLMYIQRASEARRHYASIVHVACKFDGTSPNGFLSIETESMLEFLEDFYKHSKVKPEEIDLVEAYGSANKNIDKNEIDALEKIYCKNRKNPLLIGSIKTITGHSEPTSALFSIIKIILAMENEKIPATLQYETPNPEIKALNNGAIEVVTTNRKWDSKYAAVNALSTSSHMGHIILKANPKKKEDLPIDLPILLIASTRTEEGISSIIETFKKKPKDAEYNKLVQDVFSKSIQGHLYRGYLMMGQEDIKQDTINHMGNKRPIWFVYSGMGSQWNGMLGDLMKIDVFAQSIKRSSDILAKKDVDLMKILSSSDKTIFDTILNCFVGIAAMQIALTDVLKALGIVPDGIIGHSVGELGCAYADGCMTAEQMILSSYSRGRASIEASLIPGMMAAIGLGYNQIKNKLPPTIEVACHNGPDSCTISGPTEDMEGFVKDLQNQGVFARLVNVANIAYHSRYIKPAAPLLLKYLKQVIPKPMARSSKWITTSNMEANWDTDLAKHSSAEYHTNNLLSSVLFEEGIKHIPKDSVLIEIAPHGLLQAILKRSVKECTSIPLTQRGAKSSSEFFFNSLGKIYLSGVDIKLANIYPKIEYPVSRNTSSLSDLVHWNHTETWNRSQEAQRTITGVRNINININSEEFSYCFAHKLHEQIVVPVSTYLDIILQITDNAFGGHGVVFENVHFKRHLIVPNIGFVSVNAVVQPGSGEFEIFSDKELVVKGKITIVEDKDDMDALEDLEIPVTKESVHLLENDVYTELEHRGYKLDGIFKGIKQLTLSQKGSTVCREWNKKWKDLIETMIQQHAFHVGERNQQVFVPKYIQKISMVHGLLPSTNTVKINYEYCTRSLFTSGIEMNDIKSIPLQIKTKNVELNGVDIMQLDDTIFSEIEFGIEQALQLTINNFKEPNIGKVCISEVNTELPLQDQIKKVISKYNTINIKSSYVKEVKQIVMADNFPQLIVMNDIVNSEILSLLSNSWSAFLFAKDDPGRNMDDGNIAIVSRFRYGSDHYVICRKATTSKASIININQKELSIKDLEKKSVPWVTDLFNTIKQNQKTPILLVTSTIPTEGFINFIKGIKRIPNSNNIRIFYNLDENPQCIEDALNRNLNLTILKNNRWYTYLSMSLKFDETTVNKSSQTPLIENRLISYIGLNLKDETITPELRNKNEIGNIDYCGVTKNGQRVMGLAYLDQESSKLVVDDILTWDVPEGFTLDDAVTVPHAYVSAYYMMVIKGRLKHGDTVLIHAGCSAIGLAALSIAFSYGCQIYTTVQTNQQRVYLKKHYVFLKDRNILDSSSNFETDFLLATGGNGAQLLLNCLSGSSLKSTFACTGKFGRFIQYCKYDLEQGNTIGMSPFLNNVDFYHVDLQNVFHQDKSIKQEIRNLINEGFKTYIVRPLRKDIIKHHNISTIMKKLESPEIIGKIIIDAVNNLSVNKLNVKEPHRFICNSRSTYLVFGGSAESWIDIAEWLVHRGARKIIISSNSKPTENYLNRRLTILENYYGADIIMAASKIHSENAALELLSEVSNLGSLNTMFILPNETGSSAYVDEIVQQFDKALRKIAPRALLVNFISSSTGICYKRSMSGYSTNNIEFSDQEKIGDIIPSLDAILNSSCNNVLLKKLNSGDSADNAGIAVINDATRLLPKLEDIINLQKNAPNEPELVQVLTEGPAEIRELAPVFIIPGLTGYKELETFTRHLLYPAFCAVYPSTPWAFEKLAEVYAQKIIEVFPREFYNILSISSGGPLAIEVAKILTKKTADVHLFFIDSPPIRVQQGFQNIGENDLQVEVDLLRTVFEKNDLEIVKQLKSCPNFEARIKVLLQKLDKSEKSKKLLEKGLIFMKDFMERVKRFKPDNELLPGRVHILVPEDCNAFENYGLSSYFQNTPTITQVPGDHLSIITNSITFEYVNKNHYQIY